MKIIVGSILILLMLLQIFSKWLLVAEYVINKDYIAKNLCENKEKPQLKCKGKCQLMKKMAEETESSRSASGNATVKSNLSEVLPFQDLSNIFVPGVSANKISHNSLYLLKEYTAPFKAVFHPPVA